jgi:hypothetical protein
MKSIEIDNKQNKEKGSTWPVILFMAGMVLLMILLKLALNYFHS